MEAITPTEKSITPTEKTSAPAETGGGRQPNRSTLLAQAIATNALAVFCLIFFAVLVANVNAGGNQRRTEMILLMVAIAAVLSLNIFLLRRQFAPLERLVSTMEEIDLTKPGVRAEMPRKATEDIAELVDTFNAMIERLEDERLGKAQATIDAQEAERARVARDLHDEANQALTAVILRLQVVGEDAPPELAKEIEESKRLVTQAMEELLQVVRQLRPTTLDLGLRGALSAQVAEFGEHSGIKASFECEGEREQRLADDLELAIYRVAQEALTNIAKHADASQVEVTLDLDKPVVLTVHDNGTGFNPDRPTNRFGVVGMRERAILVGGTLTIDSTPDQGTTLRMEIP